MWNRQRTFSNGLLSLLTASIKKRKYTRWTHEVNFGRYWLESWLISMHDLPWGQSETTATCSERLSILNQYPSNIIVSLFMQNRLGLFGHLFTFNDWFLSSWFLFILLLGTYHMCMFVFGQWFCQPFSIVYCYWEVMDNCLFWTCVWNSTIPGSWQLQT